MGFFDWLLGEPKKRKGQSSARPPAGKATGVGASPPTTAAMTQNAPRTRQQQKPPGKGVLRTDKESSQAQDIVRGWLKDDS